MGVDGSCEFCAQIARRYTIRDRIIYQSDCVTIWPSLGALTRGHVLLVPNAHRLGLLCAALREREEILSLMEDLRGDLGRGGTTVLIGEHGNQAPTGGDGFAPQCVSHAHVHVIPVPVPFSEIMASYKAVLGEPDRCLGDAELMAVDDTAEYQMLGCGDGEWFLWRDCRRAGSQFIRRVAAQALGRPDAYNWREHPNYELIEQTRDLFAGRFTDLPHNAAAGWARPQARFDLG